jgi:hypothetical protein
LAQDFITRFYPVPWFFGSVANKDFAPDNQIDSQGAGTVWQVCGDDGIEPPALVGFIG